MRFSFVFDWMMRDTYDRYEYESNNNSISQMCTQTYHKPIPKSNRLKLSNILTYSIKLSSFLKYFVYISLSMKVTECETRQRV